MDALGMALKGSQFMQDTVTADHYIIAGKKYARVTTIVKAAGLSDFSGIPERDRDYYFERGTQNHAMWAHVEEGTADQFDFDPAVQLYRAGHARFLRETGFRALPGGIEMRVKNDDLGYAGTLDRIGTVGSRVWLVDLKTSQVYDKAAAIQTALYLLAIPGYRFKEVERYGVAILNNGTYKMSQRYPDSDENDAIFYAQKFQKEARI